MKRISLVLSVLILIICSTGCSKMSDNEVIDSVKSKYLSGYTNKSIGNAVDGYFNNCNVEWSVSQANNNDTYTVHANIQPRNKDYFEFKHNNEDDEILYIRELDFFFKYNSNTSEVNEYVEVLCDTESKFYDTDSVSESYYFLNRIFGQANTNQYNYQSEINHLNSLRKKIEEAKTVEEAREIASKDDKFPFDLDFMNKFQYDKKLIISVIDGCIKVEQETNKDIENLYN